MNPQGGVLAVQADVREGGVGGQGQIQQDSQHHNQGPNPRGKRFPLQGPLDPCLPKAGGQQGPPAGGGQGQQGGGILPGAAAGFQHSLVAFQLQIPHQQNPGQPENWVEPVDAHDQKIDELTPGVAQLDVALLVAAHPPQVLPLQPCGDVHPGAEHAEHKGGGDPVTLPPPALPDGALPHSGGQQGTGSQPGEQGIAPHRDHTGQPHPGQDVRERQPFRLGLRFRGGRRLGDGEAGGGGLLLRGRGGPAVRCLCRGGGGGRRLRRRFHPGQGVHPLLHRRGEPPHQGEGGGDHPHRQHHAQGHHQPQEHAGQGGQPEPPEQPPQGQGDHRHPGGHQAHLEEHEEQISHGAPRFRRSSAAAPRPPPGTACCPSKRPPQRRAGSRRSPAPPPPRSRTGAPAPASPGR